MDPITLWIIAGIAGAIFAGAITWKAVNQWLTVARSKGTWARLIKTRVDNGDFVVVGGVFDARNTLVEEKSWQAKKLDNELEQKFSESDRVIIRF